MDLLSILTATVDKHPLATFFLLGLAGVMAGKLAEKIRLPDVSGQILAGLVLGPSVFGLFTTENVHDFKMITEIALGMMTFIAGTHLSLKKLHNSGGRMLTIAMFDVLLTMWIVFTALTLFTNIGFTARLIISSIAIATAPGTIIGLIQAKKARGPMVKTLIGVVALNNVATIVIFEFCKILCIQSGNTDPNAILGAFSSSFLYLMEDVMVGIVMGWIAARMTAHMHKESGLFTFVFLAIIGNVVVCQYFPRLSIMLMNLVAGLAFANLSYHVKKVSSLLEEFNGLLFAVFFTLAGAHLDLSLLKVAGFTGLVYVLSRITAKILAVYTAGHFFSYSKRITNTLGFGLIPQAGLAIGLVISLSEYEQFTSNGLASTIGTIVLAAVVINEIIGPFTTSKGFDLAKESGQATPRLIDFLHEEYILKPLVAKNKWEAIDAMCSFLVKTNHLRSISFEDLRKSVIDREKSFSTGFGNKLAVPHARVPAKEHVMGVIGLLDDPIEFDSIDGEKVDIIILIATPEGKEEVHLKIFSVIAKIFADDPKFHDQLVMAENPAEVYDILQSKEVREINYFLDEDL